MGEQRLVTGVVMDPTDGVTPEHVSEVFYAQTMAAQPTDVVNDRYRIVQNYLAPERFVAEDGSVVEKGAWVMEVHVVDDELWESITTGTITGFSVGGKVESLSDTRLTLGALRRLVRDLASRFRERVRP